MFFCGQHTVEISIRTITIISILIYNILVQYFDVCKIYEHIEFVVLTLIEKIYAVCKVNPKDNYNLVLKRLSKC